MDIRVLMIPNLSMFDNDESGIKRVVEAYEKFGPRYGIQYVRCDIEDVNAYDVFAVHAGNTSRYPKNKPIVSHLHGLYWTGDGGEKNPAWEWRANSLVIDSAKRATIITVPSAWVAESIARDMRVSPVIINHGIQYKDWIHSNKNEGYVLWNKNRNVDVCNPLAVGKLASVFPEIEFVTTFEPREYKLANIHTIGLQQHSFMKNFIQRAGVYLSTTKETFGIGILEALASGVPVLSFNHGGALEMITHGINGYLATKNDYDDLANGLKYCIENREVLSSNAKKTVVNWGWDTIVEKLADTYRNAFEIYNSNKRERYIPESSYAI